MNTSPEFKRSTGMNPQMKTFPGWLMLMELWLGTHHQGQPAVVFSQPGESFKLWYKTLTMHFGADSPKCIGSEFAVLPCSTLAKANKVMLETPGDNPFTLVWDGTKVLLRK